MLLAARKKSSLVNFGANSLARGRPFNPPFNLHLDDAWLANTEALDNIEPEDIEAAWLKQNWRQAQVDMQLEVPFKLNAPERLRVLQILNAAHRATGITSLVRSKEGPVDLWSRSWALRARVRTGLALDALDFRPCLGCRVMMDNSVDHVLCCHKLGIYARHNIIRNELVDLCWGLSLHVDIEKGPDGSLLWPGDVLVHGIVD